MTQPVSAIPRSERIARWILAISFVLLVVVLAGTFIKVPYAVEKPGPVTDTLGALDDGTDLVRVKGTKSYPTDGALYFTTVRVLGGPERHINVWEWVAGHLDGDSRVLPEEEVFPADTTDEEVREMNTAQMQGAQKNSIAVGLRSTGVKVPQVNLVATIAEDLPADGRLALEDEVLEVDGKRTEHVADIVSAISDRTPGDTVRLTVERKGREREVEMKTTDLGGGRAGIGIALEPKYDYPYEVRIDAGDVGGPSAGMMFALAVHDRITPGPLTGGEQIAGTGTIDDAGTVGPIGGIQQSSSAPRPVGRSGSWRPRATATRSWGTSPTVCAWRRWATSTRRPRPSRPSPTAIPATCRRASRSWPAPPDRRVSTPGEGEGSVLERRAQGVDEAGGDVLAGGHPVVAVVGPLTQQAHRPTVTVHRHEQPHVLALRVRREGIDGGVGVLGQVTLGAGRDDDALDGEGDPVDGLGPGHPAEQRLELRRARQVLLLDRGERARCAVGVAGERGGQLGLGRGEGRGVDEGEDAGFWSHPEAATWRSVPRAATASGSVVGVGSGDESGTKTMLPYGRSGGLGTVASP